MSMFEVWSDGKTACHLFTISKMDKERAERYFHWKKHFEGSKRECMLYCENERNKEQLTKAKEIIKRYVKIYVNPYPEEEIELRNEAEQFISEVEK